MSDKDDKKLEWIQHKPEHYCDFGGDVKITWRMKIKRFFDQIIRWAANEPDGPRFEDVIYDIQENFVKDCDWASFPSIVDEVSTAAVKQDADWSQIIEFEYVFQTTRSDEDGAYMHSGDTYIPLRSGKFLYFEWNMGA